MTGMDYKKQRMLMGLTQEDLAYKLNLNVRQIQRRENSKTEDGKSKSVSREAAMAIHLLKLQLRGKVVKAGTGYAVAH